MAFDNTRLMRICGSMRKRGAAILTPEAEQAAVGAPMDPGMGGAPMDPAAAGGMPPQGGAPLDPAAMGGMPQAPGMAAGPNGGQIPPEILQDQGFVQWLAQQGIQLDPASGTFIDMQSGQPVPADVIMQAYSEYQSQGGAPAPGAGSGMPPADPAAGGMPPAGGAPADPAAMGGAPMDPAAAGGMPPAPASGGQVPPEVTQDQMFMQFLQEAMGTQFDPNSGTFIDTQSGQPIPPDAIMQAYQAFQQQLQSMQGGAPAPGAEAGMSPDGAMPPEGGDMAPAPEQGGMPMGGDMMGEIQKMIDTSIDNYTSQIDKKLETLMDKIDTLKLALEAVRDTDDARTGDERKAEQTMRDEIAADLQPTKTASVSKPAQRKQASRRNNTMPGNIFDLIMNK